MFTGDLLHQSIMDYLDSLPENDEIDDEGYSSPCWEMNSHTAMADARTGAKARIPKELNQACMNSRSDALGWGAGGKLHHRVTSYTKF